jgi:hypothetical protein
VTLGGDPENPLRHEHAIDLSSMSDEDLAELARGAHKVKPYEATPSLF